MIVTEEQKLLYIELVKKELRKKSLSDEKINLIISKSKFYEVMKLFPEEQLHDSPSKAAEEILLSAAIA